MFEGKMLRELAGIPIRRIDLANRELALAEPDPLTLANLTTKSLTLWIAAVRRFDFVAIGSVLVNDGIRVTYPDRHPRESGGPGAPGDVPAALGPRFRGDDESGHRVRHAGPARVMSRRNLRMSQAPVGQRSAHRPQCRQTSSS